MCVYDESLTVELQMYETWSTEIGKLESLGQHMYVPGENKFTALYTKVHNCIKSGQCAVFIVVFKYFF